MAFEAEKTHKDKACGFSGEVKLESPAVFAHDEKEAVDCFYEKLSKLHESSGLTFVFNFRETIFDLYLFFREVMKRGGFSQVSKYGKWDEVESALNLKSSVRLLPVQLQMVYETLLFHFEQLYREMPDKANTYPNKKSLALIDSELIPCDLMGKRRHFVSSSPSSQTYSGDSDGPAAKRKSCCDTSQVATVSKAMNENSSKLTPSKSNENEIRKHIDAPQKPRNGYQIYLRLECHRLKMIDGENSGPRNLRDMANQSWRSLSDEDKKPYIEASKMDKERYEREMAAYSKCRGNNEDAKSQSLFNHSTSRMVSFSTPSETNNDYHISLQPGNVGENIVSPNEATVEMAFKVMKNAEPKYSPSQTELLNCDYFDMPNEMDQ